MKEEVKEVEVKPLTLWEKERKPTAEEIARYNKAFLGMFKGRRGPYGG